MDLCKFTALYFHSASLPITHERLQIPAAPKYCIRVNEQIQNHNCRKHSMRELRDFSSICNLTIKKTQFFYVPVSIK
jgi:hypothetical protein